MPQYFIWEDRLKDSATEAVLGTAPAELAAGVRFDEGRRITAALPSALRMSVPKNASAKHLTDNLLTYGQWAVLASPKLRHALERAGVDNIDWYKLALRDEETSRERDDYSVGNVVGLVDCVDWEKAEIDDDEAFFGKLWLDPKKCTDLLMFRMLDYEHHLVVHEAVQAAIEQAGVTGVAFAPANGYRDEGYEDDDDDDEDDEE